jgi:hypothetical protein
LTSRTVALELLLPSVIVSETEKETFVETLTTSAGEKTTISEFVKLAPPLLI